MLVKRSRFVFLRVSILTFPHPLNGRSSPTIMFSFVSQQFFYQSFILHAEPYSRSSIATILGGRYEMYEIEANESLAVPAITSSIR